MVRRGGTDAPEPVFSLFSESADKKRKKGELEFLWLICDRLLDQVKTWTLAGVLAGGRAEALGPRGSGSPGRSTCCLRPLSHFPGGDLQGRGRVPLSSGSSGL